MSEEPEESPNSSLENLPINHSSILPPEPEHIAIPHTFRGFADLNGGLRQIMQREPLSTETALAEDITDYAHYLEREASPELHAHFIHTVDEFGSADQRLWSFFPFPQAAHVIPLLSFRTWIRRHDGFRPGLLSTLEWP